MIVCLAPEVVARTLFFGRVNNMISYYNVVNLMNVADKMENDAWVSHGKQGKRGVCQEVR